MCGCLQSLMAFGGILRVFKHSKAACEAQSEVEDTDEALESERLGERGRKRKGKLINILMTPPTYSFCRIVQTL